MSVAAPQLGELEGFRPPRWWVPVLIGVLAIVAGILALVWPGPTLLLVGVCFGVFLVFAGAGDLVSAFAGAGASTFARVLEGLLGVLTLLAGFLLLTRPGASVLVVAFVLGLWFLLSGSLQLGRGIAVAEHRAWDVGFGLLGVAAGVIILAQPKIGVVTLVYIVSIAFLLRGMLLVALGVGLRKLERGA